MELVEGPSLADVLEGEGPLPPARALSIARQLFAVLAEGTLAACPPRRQAGQHPPAALRR